MQERLTTQVADALMEILEARGVIVVIEAEHLCMTMRGVRKAGARTITSAVRGIMHNAATRAEAMALIHRGTMTAVRRAAVAPAGDGHRQRHPRLVLRRRPVGRPRRGGRARAAAARRRAPTCVDVGGESTRPGRRPGPLVGRGARPGASR